MTPHGDNGSVAGMGVPMDVSATKSDLSKPLSRGIYALTSVDQKTVLKLRVFSKEEANFQPDLILESSIARTFTAEERSRIRATWTILQLTFESYDPEFYPALDFLLKVASRIGELCEGMIADPLSLTYRHPATIPSPRSSDQKVTVTDFVQIGRSSEGSGVNLQTAGLIKFDQPEILMSLVPEKWVGVAESLILSTVNGVLLGNTLSLGDKLVSENGWIVSRPGTTAIGSMPSVVELMPLGHGSVAESLAEWMKNHA